MRVLDIDLDFFLNATAHWQPADTSRLDPAQYPPWSRDAAIGFLESRCRLTDRLPGFVVENHGELFGRWRHAINAGVLHTPLSVTHVDAHLDLGLGDAGYMYLITELLFRPLPEREHPDPEELTDGNWLAFAIACRWLSDLTCVRNGVGGGRPGDLMVYVMENFDLDATNLQLAAMTDQQFQRRAYGLDFERRSPIESDEPKVPFRHMVWRDFEAEGRFDVVCLTRSPAYTPADLDPFFDEIRDRYIDETAFPVVAP